MLKVHTDLITELQTNLGRMVDQMKLKVAADEIESVVQLVNEMFERVSE